MRKDGLVPFFFKKDKKVVDFPSAWVYTYIMKRKGETTMTKVNYTIEEKTLWTVTIRVDTEVATGHRLFTGYNLKDAIRNANKRLAAWNLYIED